MPTQGRRRPSALDHATRQQLDELDALMQRMLALPVNPSEDLVTPGAETVSERTSASSAMHARSGGGAPAPLTEPSQPTRDQHIRIEEDTAKSNAGLSPPKLAIAPLPPSPESVENWSGTPRTLSPPAGNVFAGLEPPRKVSVHPARARPEAKAGAPRLVWPLRPLLWVNVAFDGGTGWLGPAGRWLRGPGGRALLGWAGFLLLAAALASIALAAVGMGWTW
jgi:hypothetical protein